MPQALFLNADAILARLASFDKPTARRTDLGTALSPPQEQQQQQQQPRTSAQPLIRAAHVGEHRKGPEMLPGVQAPPPVDGPHAASAPPAPAISPDRDLKDSSADSSIESLLPRSSKSRLSIQTAVNDSSLANLRKDVESERAKVKRLDATLQEKRRVRCAVEDEHERLKKVVIGLRAKVEEANKIRPAFESAEYERGQLTRDLATAREQLDESTAALCQLQQKLRQVEAEYGDAVREIVRLEEREKEKFDAQEHTISSGNQLIELRLSYVDAERDRRRALLDLEQIEAEKHALVDRCAQAEQAHEKLKTAMVRYRHERDLELQQKDQAIEALRARVEEERQERSRASAPSAAVALGTAPPEAVIARLHEVMRESEAATRRLRRHLKAVMLRVDDIPSDSNSGVMSRHSLLQLATEADEIFAERAQLVLPDWMNASIDQREDRGVGVSPPIKPLHEQLNKAR